MGNMQQIHRFTTIGSFHQFRGLPRPEHPLISIIDAGGVKELNPDEPKYIVFNFYVIAIKRVLNAKMKYGQQDYDFDAGTMSFSAPGQVISVKMAEGEKLEQSGWVLLIHPDFLWNTPLAKNIKQYDFFDYSVNEGLFLSDKEEAIIAGIIQIIQQEYQSSIDKFSQDIIIAQLEVLLTYAERFYQRQFVTRKIVNHQILTRLEDLLNAYFNSAEIMEKGLPTVNHIAAELNVSPGYLGGMLRSLTGLNTQQHIHLKLIEKAKEKLSTTNLSVSEIAYELGFEHIQSFSKLFKTKTNLSPLEFRAAFN
jgi:AraC family transcriptional activator of pobA